MRVLLSEAARSSEAGWAARDHNAAHATAGRSSILNQRCTASLSAHGKFRKIAFSVDMFLFPNPFAECSIVSGLLERPKIHFTLKDIKK
jgi:hypothetical protein